MSDYDVAVAGGGPAGAAVSIVLARLGWRVLLADASDAEAFRVGEGFAPMGHSLLRELGVLERFLTDQHRISYGTVSAWGSDELQAIDFMLNLQGHGYQLDRVRFDAMLRQAAREAGAEVCEGTRLEPLFEQSGVTEFRLTDEQKPQVGPYSAKWLVDATGRTASIARTRGGSRVNQDRLLAFWALLDSSDNGDCDGRTLVEAEPDGWWYSVLLPSGKRLAAYLTDADLADRPACLSSEGFQEKLFQTNHLHTLCIQHGYHLSQKPRGADASSARLDRFFGSNWLAVGDAALSFDPLSSQGILNALHTGIRAGKSLDSCLQGEPSALDAYADHLADIHTAYLSNRAKFYSVENRWIDKEFWVRRQRDGDKRGNVSGGKKTLL